MTEPERDDEGEGQAAADSGLSSNKQAGILVGLSFVAFGLGYATTILSARAVGPEGYDDFAVAVSTAAILSTLAELGIGKYALRVVPAFRERHEWGLLHGFRRFTFVAVGLFAVLLAGGTVLLEGLERGQYATFALGVLMLFLPAMACVGVGADLLMGHRAAVRSGLVMRVVVPGTSLLLLLLWELKERPLGPAGAAAIFGAGSVVGLVVLTLFLRQVTPDPVRKAPAEWHAGRWVGHSLPFLGMALLITLLIRAAVLVLELVDATDETIGAYAAAAETGAFVYLLAKSTDKLYLPDASLLIERGDMAALRRARTKRWLFLGPACAAFLVAVFVWGKDILRLFGDEDFVAGYPALCIISAGTSVWTMLSVAPTYLQYRGQNTLVLTSTVITILVHIGLCAWLGSRYGATGAALSFAVPVSVLHVGLAIHASRQLKELEREQAALGTVVRDEEL